MQHSTAVLQNSSSNRLGASLDSGTDQQPFSSTHNPSQPSKSSSTSNAPPGQSSSSSTSQQQQQQRPSPHSSEESLPNPDANAKSTRKRKRSHVPLENRIRVVQACQNCRRRKLRCPGSQPCERCIQSKSECIYPARTPQKPRSGPSTEYLTELKERELYLEFIVRRHLPNFDMSSNNLRRVCTELKNSNDSFIDNNGNISYSSNTNSDSNTDTNSNTNADIKTKNNISNNTNTNNNSTSSNTKLNDNQFNNNNNNNKQLSNDTTKSENRSSTYENTEDVEDVVNGRGHLMADRPGHAHYLGESAGWSFLDSIRGTITADTTVLDVASEYNQMLARPNPYQPSQRPTCLAPVLPPPQVASFLIDTFFKHGNFQLFSSHENVFRRQVSMLYETVDTDREDTPFLGVLLVVLATGMQFSELEKGFNSNALENNNFTSQDLHPGIEYYRAAVSLLPQILASCTLTSIQFCHIMSSYLQWSNARDASYTYLGLALRMAISNGMHRTCNISLDPRIVEMRRRLFWSIYTLDRFTSVAMGRPLTLSDSDCDVNMPTYLLGIDSPQFSGSLEIFRKEIDIAKIFGRIMTKIYTIPTPPVKSSVINRGNLLDLLGDLSSWRENLPSWIEDEISQPQSNLFRKAVHLRMAYCYAVILVTRPFLLHRVRVRKSPKNPEEKNSSLIEQLSKSCIDAAKEQIKLCDKLYRFGSLCRFEFWDYHYCCAGVHVLVLASLYKWDESQIAFANRGIEIMDYMGTVNESSSLSVTMMKQLMVIVNENRPKSSLPQNNKLAPHPHTQQQQQLQHQQHHQHHQRQHQHQQQEQHLQPQQQQTSGSVTNIKQEIPQPSSNIMTSPPINNNSSVNPTGATPNSTTPPGLNVHDPSLTSPSLPTLEELFPPLSTDVNVTEDDSFPLLGDWLSQGAFSLYGLDQMTLDNVTGFPVNSSGEFNFEPNNL